MTDMLNREILTPHKQHTNRQQMTMPYREEIRRRHDEALANVRQLRKQAAHLNSMGLWKEAAKFDRKANELARKSLDLVDDMYPGSDWWQA
ncbi:hypothetical protein [Xanthomonas phage OP1]|uniref:Uncharacterized protein n=1 Tax=Xanthomonas phage OP1 TaxID=2994040 RepID=Q2NPE4_9CAUD|nr:hypothetical protein OP1_ORF47 [Xanthomonas phage OP1]BAE72752.1 hypothetical protein [Xanthomonas phage OP1]